MEEETQGFLEYSGIDRQLLGEDRIAMAQALRDADITLDDLEEQLPLLSASPSQHQLKAIGQFVHLCKNRPHGGICLNKSYSETRILAIISAMATRKDVLGCFTLVVCLDKMRAEWKLSIEKCFKYGFPNVAVPETEKTTAADLLKGKWDFVIVSYEQVVSEYNATMFTLKDTPHACLFADIFKKSHSPFKHLIVDMHLITSSIAGQVCKAMKHLFYSTSFVLCDTPARDHWTEIFHLFDLLPNEPFKGVDDFGQFFCQSSSKLQLTMECRRRIASYAQSFCFEPPGDSFSTPKLYKQHVLYSLNNDAEGDVWKFTILYLHAMSSEKIFSDKFTAAHLCGALKYACNALAASTHPSLVSKKVNKSIEINGIQLAKALIFMFCNHVEALNARLALGDATTLPNWANLNEDSRRAEQRATRGLFDPQRHISQNILPSITGNYGLNFLRRWLEWEKDPNARVLRSCSAKWTLHAGAEDKISKFIVSMSEDCISGHDQVQESRDEKQGDLTHRLPWNFVDKMPDLMQYSRGRVAHMSGSDLHSPFVAKVLKTFQHIRETYPNEKVAIWSSDTRLLQILNQALTRIEELEADGRTAKIEPYMHCFRRTSAHHIQNICNFKLGNSRNPLLINKAFIETVRQNGPLSAHAIICEPDWDIQTERLIVEVHQGLDHSQDAFIWNMIGMNSLIHAVILKTQEEKSGPLDQLVAAIRGDVEENQRKRKRE